MSRTYGITGKTLNKAKLHNKRRNSASKDAEFFVTCYRKPNQCKEFKGKNN